MTGPEPDVPSWLADDDEAPTVPPLEAPALGGPVSESEPAVSEMKGFLDVFRRSPSPGTDTTTLLAWVPPLSPDTPVTAPVPLVPAWRVPADPTLRGRQVKVTLNHLRAADFPGGGLHRVLVELAGQAQPAVGDPVRAVLCCDVREGQFASFAGWPVFQGLPVGDEGLTLEIRVVNVANERDASLNAFLDSQAFKKGLQLASTLHPAVGLASELARGVFDLFSSRHKDALVHYPRIGLDFSPVATSPRLAEGAWFLLQGHGLDLADWGWSPTTNALVRLADPAAPVPFNYLGLGVSRLA